MASSETIKSLIVSSESLTNDDNSYTDATYASTENTTSYAQQLSNNSAAAGTLVYIKVNGEWKLGRIGTKIGNEWIGFD